jgi:hypothetical protein
MDKATQTEDYDVLLKLMLMLSLMTPEGWFTT